MSILGDIFKVAIDVVEIPVAVMQDTILVAVGERPQMTEDKLKELKKDLTEL